ncbi:MAG: ParB/RepB/Spo0J family partition protein [Anaerolineae bacterium]
MAASTKRSGLGRGLDALLSSTAPADDRPGAASAAATTEVAIADIRPNPYQPRKHFDTDELDELASSIRSHGLIQPLLVMPDGDGWCLIAGERRWRAAQLAGLTRVPVVVREATPQEMLAIAIIENVQRTNLDALEAAQAYRQLMHEFELTQADVADLVGKSRVAVANTLRLLGLAPEVQSLLSNGHLSEGHGRALLALNDPSAQIATAKRALLDGWSVRRTEAEVRRLIEPLVAAAPPPRVSAAAGAPADADTRAAAQALEGALGTRVEIRRKGDAGQVIIHFYAEEELTALYDRLIASQRRRR